MQVPPVQFDLSAEKVDPPLPRIQWVWIAFSMLFAYVIFTSLMSHNKRTSIAEDPAKLQEKAIEMQLYTKSMIVNSGADQNGHLFDQQIADLLESSKKDASAQKLRIVLRVENNAEPFKDDIANLAKSTKSEDQAFAKLYSEPKPKKEDAMSLLKQIDGSELSERIASMQIKESFGDKAIRTKMYDPSRMIGFSIVALLGVVSLGIGMILWYIYGFQRQAGKLFPKGLPMGKIDLGRADRLILVATIVISSYYLAGSVISTFIKQPTFSIGLLGYLPVFISIAICLNVPIFGWRITAKSIGISFEKLPEKVGWALAAFFANIPILLVLIAITISLQKVLPGGGHPVGDELLNNPKSLDIAKIAFLACVIAPIWEEIFFRGLLFPAFTRVFGKPLYGALLSSFIFAAIHPQGLLGIPVLMSFALMACAVSYQTKSLISNMILHGLHNGAALLAVLVVAPLLK